MKTDLLRAFNKQNSTNFRVTYIQYAIKKIQQYSLLINAMKMSMSLLNINKCQLCKGNVEDVVSHIISA